MNSNNPREQRAYKRRLQRLRARDRRWKNDDAYAEYYVSEGLHTEHALDIDELRPPSARRRRREQHEED
jgi:hypothetical protein